MGRCLEGKVTIITGAGAGIGRACAERFAAEGAHVVVNDVRADAAEAVATSIAAAGGTASACAGDVARPADWEHLVGETVTRYGHLDVLVNNAGLPGFGTIERTSDEDWRRVFAVTLDGTFHGLRAACPVIAAHGGGAVVNVASAAGLLGVPGLGAYGSAKAAVLQLTRTAALEHAARGVRVNAICPGSIGTEPMLAFADSLPGGREAFARQIPVKRLGTPDEVAAVAVFLASDAASYVTGSILVVDGGVAAGLAGASSE